MRALFATALLALAPPLAAQAPGPIVIAELMWMGSTSSSADEWVELYNRSASAIDLSGWTLSRLDAEGEREMLTIAEGTIAPGGTFLIANYRASHANSRLAVEPDYVDAALSLPNSRLQLYLYDAAGRLVDLADDGRGAPLAGDADLKQAMVRIDLAGDGAAASSWATAREASGWDAGARELGTPGSVPSYLVPPAPAPTTAVQTNSWGRLKRRALR